MSPAAKFQSPPHPSNRSPAPLHSLLIKIVTSGNTHSRDYKNSPQLYAPTKLPIMVVIFGRDEQGRHGNFHPASDTSICSNPAWLRRLTKVHTASRRSRARKDWQ